MNIKRDRLTIFIIGLVVGFLIGAVAFKIQAKEEPKGQITENKINFIIHKVIKLFSPKADLAKRTAFQKNKIVVNFRKTKLNNNYFTSNNRVLQDSSFDVYSNMDEFIAKYGDKLDSTSLDSILKSNKNVSSVFANEEIVVKKDQLILSKDIEITGFDAKQEKQRKSLDSLLVGDESKNSNSLKVEFWQSPINYKGFKMSRNKLVLYGVNPYDNPSLSLINKTIYLNVKNNKYILEYTDNFLPLRRVNEMPTKKILKK